MELRSFQDLVEGEPEKRAVTSVYLLDVFDFVDGTDIGQVLHLLEHPNESLTESNPFIHLTEYPS